MIVANPDAVWELEKLEVLRELEELDDEPVSAFPVGESRLRSSRVVSGENCGDWGEGLVVELDEEQDSDLLGVVVVRASRLERT